MNTARKGRRKEHKIRDLFREHGYIVVRSAASLGPVDLVCFPQTCRKHRMMACVACGSGDLMTKPEDNMGASRAQVVLVQVKPRTIWRAERAELLKLAEVLPGATCRVEGWVAPDRKAPYRQFSY